MNARTSRRYGSMPSKAGNPRIKFSLFSSRSELSRDCLDSNFRGCDYIANAGDLNSELYVAFFWVSVVLVCLSGFLVLGFSGFGWFFRGFQGWVFMVLMVFKEF